MAQFRWRKITACRVARCLALCWKFQLLSGLLLCQALSAPLKAKWQTQMRIDRRESEPAATRRSSLPFPPLVLSMNSASSICRHTGKFAAGYDALSFAATFL